MDHSRFIICRASAGSGKTFTLVLQFLELAFSDTEENLHDRFRHILAITFTNKAANEMKERIMHELQAIRDHGTDCDMGRELATRLQLDDNTLRRYAGIVFSAILHNYSDLSVCTIDSFMHRIVRTFAHDLNLPVNFDVYIDQSQLIQNAVDNLMALAGAEGQQELTEMLCDFAESRMAEAKSYKVENKLAELAEELFKERTYEYLQALSKTDTAQFRSIHRQLVTDNRKYEKRLRRLGGKAVKAYTKVGLDETNFYHGSNGAGAYFRKLANGAMPKPNSYVIAYLEGDKLGANGASADQTDALTAIKPKLQNIHRRICRLRNTKGVRYNTRQLLLKNLYSLALLNQLNQFVEDFSHENEIVHISEFNKRIAEVVQNEPAPFIYERIGTRYYNYLIDEFQDTSRMQWQNLVPLVENGVSANHTSLVVGDGKQAIYRFRQGDVGQFVALPHVDSPLHGRLLEHPGIAQPTRLKKNFRSTRTVVEFNNRFFDWAVRNRFDIPEVRDIYLRETPETSEADLVQLPVKEGGHIQLGFWDEVEGLDPLWQQLVDDLQAQVTGKGYHYRDIYIIARDRKTLQEASAHLTAQGIPVVSEESFLISNSTVVKLLRSLLHYLLDGQNRGAAARVLIHLQSLGLFDDDISPYFLSQEPRVDLEHILQAKGMPLDCARLRDLSLYDCCEEALRMLRLHGIETAYTATFLNIVCAYSGKHRQDIGEFLQWLSENIESLSSKTATDLDAVRLMTIHKAKGLEAPIVIYPIPVSTPKSDNIWVHIPPESGMGLPAGLVLPHKNESTLFDNEYNDELQKRDMDRLNVLYVALTRPKDKLMVYCQLPEKSGNDYGSLLHDYVLSPESGFLSLDDNRRWTLGDNGDAPARHTDNNAPEPIPVGDILFPDWPDRITIADQSSTLFGERNDEAIRRGNQVHELLALTRHCDDTANALTRYLGLHPGQREESDSLRQLLEDVVQHPDAARFFDPAYRSLRECSIAWKGEVLRPDRVVLTPDATWVVDFKTGAPAADHHSQVQTYCDAIRAMGYSNVQGFLLYLGGHKPEVVRA